MNTIIDKYSSSDYQRAVGKMVHQEVKLNVSQLVSELCNAGLYHESTSFVETHYDVLAKDDWENAAIDEGWREIYNGNIMRHASEGAYSNWAECCEEESIEPYQVEALEHWVVSDWLAGKLTASGEMIDKDVHGLVVWGRTCSGQAILLDRVICDIYDELHGE